ncbi:MAG TPA: hypothetical protein VIH42_02565 [Thermoguttaceae bacterium]
MVLFLTLTNPAWAGTSEAARRVREGIAQFHGSDFKSAAEAFSAADEALPNELRIAFDRGCAYAAQGEYDKAVEQFQKAAAAPDLKLAALADYNLGSVAAARAKAQAGEKPEEAAGEARTAIQESLAQAARHYRDCLSIDPDNNDARYNLETVRLWVKHIQDVWRERDRQKRRDEMNLLQYLEWLEAEQRTLRQTGKELAAAKPSPQQREAIRAAENEQRTLADEIEPLKTKIAAAVSAPQQQGGNTASAPLSNDSQKAVQLLSYLADEVRRFMSKSADSLAGGILPEAIESQTQAVETIDQIFMAVAPYVNLVQRGINRQEELIDQGPPAIDGNEAAWKQRFIARYGRILSVKARRELEQLESMPGAKQGPQTQTDDGAKPEEADKSPPEKDQYAATAATSADDVHSLAAGQQRDLKEALQMGITSAPKVEKLAEEAAALLEEDKRQEALPKQQEALKLLKEMLPKLQQQQQDNQNQEQQDQKNKDQNKKDQNKQTQNDKDKKDQDKQNQQNQQGQNKQDQQKKDAEKNQQQQQQAQKQRDPSKEQADAVLSRARQRREQYREMEKAIEGYLYRPEKLEKDW